MALQDSRDEYARRMHKVQEYIDQHLDEALELPDLARVAHFSAFHFHRLFRAWMGETLGDYLRRRRLETAALRLIAQPEVPVLNIALDVGFGSQEAFARAFKTRFGMTATGWREQQARERAQRLADSGLPDSNPGQTLRNPGQASPPPGAQHGDSSTTESAMQVKIVEREPVQIAYMRHVGPYGPDIGAFWINAFAPWMTTHHLMGAVRYGISHDDPAITAPEKCRYDACVEVPAGFKVPPPAIGTTLPGGKYACAYYKGNGSDIGLSWNALLRDWLPASGMQLDGRPFFEYYPTDAQYDPRTGVFDCQICVPVVALQG
jgi:AraC family transcriptional regulator